MLFIEFYLPVKNLLVINEPAALTVDDFLSKMFILQQIQKMQTLNQINYNFT